MEEARLVLTGLIAALQRGVCFGECGLLLFQRGCGVLLFRCQGDRCASSKEPSTHEHATFSLRSTQTKELLN